MAIEVANLRLAAASTLSRSALAAADCLAARVQLNLYDLQSKTCVRVRTWHHRALVYFDRVATRVELSVGSAKIGSSSAQGFQLLPHRLLALHQVFSTRQLQKEF